MLESLLQFLRFIPAGLLIAAVCVESFVLSRRDRDSEPAVLWLLCCAAVAAAIISILSFTLYFVEIDSSGLKSGLWSGAIAAAASVAWMLKRIARNRSFLLLGERFFDTSNRKLPPRRKPWQALLLVGYRVVLTGAVLCGAGALIALPKWSGAGYSRSSLPGVTAASALAVPGAAPVPPGFILGTNTVAGTYPRANYVEFKGVVGPSGAINLNYTWIAGISDGAGISGFQLNVIPEPTSMGLMGLGFLLAARRRRR